jgi:hypothetical protein
MKFINIIKFTINIITIEKNIDLILMVKSIVVVVVVIVINLGLTSPSRPKKLGVGKVHLIQVAWEWQDHRFKSLGSCSTAWPKILESGVWTQGKWV